MHDSIEHDLLGGGDGAVAVDRVQSRDDDVLDGELARAGKGVEELWRDLSDVALQDRRRLSRSGPSKELDVLRKGKRMISENEREQRRLAAAVVPFPDASARLPV